MLFAHHVAVILALVLVGPSVANVQIMPSAKAELHSDVSFERISDLKITTTTLRFWIVGYYKQENAGGE